MIEVSPYPSFQEAQEKLGSINGFLYQAEWVLEELNRGRQVVALTLEIGRVWIPKHISEIEAYRDRLMVLRERCLRTLDAQHMEGLL